MTREDAERCVTLLQWLGCSGRSGIAKYVKGQDGDWWCDGGDIWVTYTGAVGTYGRANRAIPLGLDVSYFIALYTLATGRSV